MPVYAAAVR